MAELRFFVDEDSSCQNAEYLGITKHQPSSRRNLNRLGRFPGNLELSQKQGNQRAVFPRVVHYYYYHHKIMYMYPGSGAVV